MATRQDQKMHVNFAMKIRGYLGHDNYLWDMKCPQCGKMYSHFTHSTCPQCHSPLQWLTTRDGQKTMAISEGTIYPMLTDKEKERYEKHRASTGGLRPYYRFKVFGFGASIHTPPEIPTEHENMRKGALVEIIVMNHQPILIPFQTRAGEAAVEISLSVFTEYGDSIKIISHPRKVAEVGTAPEPQQPTADIQALQAQLIQLQQVVNSLMQRPPQSSPVAQPGAGASVKSDDGEAVPLDLFANAVVDDDDCPF